MQKRMQKTNRRINSKISKYISICNGNLNKLISLLIKGVYPYEDIHYWEKFDETTIPPEESFYSELNLENITDKDYAHAQKVWEIFGMKNLGEYHDLYAQSDTLLLADLFEFLEISVMKYINLVLYILCLHQE